MKRVTGTIAQDGYRVAWTMSASEARELAEFIEDHIKWDDTAHGDVGALREAAHLIDGEGEER